MCNDQANVGYMLYVGPVCDGIYGLDIDCHPHVVGIIFQYIPPSGFEIRRFFQHTSPSGEPHHTFVHVANSCRPSEAVLVPHLHT